MRYEEQFICKWNDIEESYLYKITLELKKLITCPAVIILSGEMGVGKTTFCKNFIDDENITSPTFSIINELNDSLHADFYRLMDKREIIHLEISLYLEGTNYFLIEWGDSFIKEIYEEVGSLFSFYKLNLTFNQTDIKKRNFRLVKISF